MLSEKLKGQEINIINTNVTGQKKTYELWIHGSVISITDPKKVKEIDNIIAEKSAMDKKGIKIDIKKYLLFEILRGRLD